MKTIEKIQIEEGSQIQTEEQVVNENTDDDSVEGNGVEVNAENEQEEQEEQEEEVKDE